MLILSRNPGEGILIGDEVTVRIVRVWGDSVDIAIEAPRRIRILRSELQPQARINGIRPSPLRPLTEALSLLPRLSMPFAGQIS